MLALVTTWFSGVWAKVAAWGAIAVAVIGGLLTLYLSIKKSGETEQVNADLTKEVKDVQESKAVADTVSAMPDSTVDSQLRLQFSRD